MLGSSLAFGRCPLRQHAASQGHGCRLGFRYGQGLDSVHGRGRMEVIVQAGKGGDSSQKESKRTKKGRANGKRVKAAKDDSMRESDSDTETKMKISAAAKISAARSLARKLSEEKVAAAAAADLMSREIVDDATGKYLKQSVENEVAAFAKEAGSADAAARMAKKGGISSELAELERLKRENMELQNLLLQLARDREEAEEKLRQLPSSSSQEEPASAKKASRKKKGPSKATAEAIAQAEENGEAVALIPESPVEVDSSIEVLYNIAMGPLPDGSAAPVLKIGYNRWETLEKFDMQKVQGKDNWYSVKLKLPALLFRVDFVFEDKNSGAVDNNNGQDFTFELDGAPTAEEVTALRVKMLDDFEQQMHKEFSKEEDAIHEAAMKAARGAATEAKLAFVAKRKEMVLQEARDVVSERRQSNIEESPEIAFKWLKKPAAGGMATIIYNKSSGPLASASSVSVMVGYDSWWMQDTEAITMVPVPKGEIPRDCAEGEWVMAKVSVWNTAAVLDFAFCDGNRQVWDNAAGSDYHTRVQNATPSETLVQLVFEALQASDASDSSVGEEMAAKRVLQRVSMRSNASRRRRELQRQFLFTVPMTPQAGKKATVYYNPDRTVLRGRPDVFLSGGFNRSIHNEKIQPELMAPAVPGAGGLGFLQAVVDIPADAHTLDLTFSDSSDMHGGFFDTNNGLGYHIPVSGSTSSENPLFVAHIASEMAPIAKAGGLGDVVTALGRAVQEEGHNVEVVIPKYDCIDYSQVQDLKLDREFMWEGVQVKVWKGIVEDLPTTFLEPCNGLVWVGSIYTNMNSDRHRFGVFCACALHYLLSESAKKPTLLHCHDWQSAPVAFMDRKGVPCAFTIHNMDFGADLISRAVEMSEVSTTVSPTYAVEIGGHSGIAPHHHKFYGIRNGIDVDIWDPSSDPALPVSYTYENLYEGKQAAKAALRQRMSLADGDVPIVGCVTRLTHQKGIHLIKHAAWRAMERGAQFVLLGSAPDPAVQADFDALAEDLKAQYPDRARLWFAYDEPLSHLIFAGSDMFLVPSMFEPCGLTQMIAMRYGTVPVVRRTGGLADTVFDVDDDVEKAKAAGLQTNGFSFDGADTGGLDYALNRGMSLYFSDKKAWNELSKRVMLMDWSWTNPAQDYIELYHKALS